MDSKIERKELFYEYKDFQRRLDGGFLVYNGEVKYVSTFEGRGGMYMMKLYTVENLHAAGVAAPAPEVFEWGPDFDLTPAPLGYHGKNDKCCYLMRAALRKQKQLTHAEHIMYNTYPDFRNTHPWNPHSCFTKEFRNCILGQHQPFEQAIKVMRDPKNSIIPIHRNFAIAKDKKENSIELLYKNQLYGRWDVDKMVLLPHFSNCTSVNFLLEELHIPVAI